MSYQKSNPHSIKTMFNGIAKRYDFTNAVLSFRMHKKWNRSLVFQVIPHLEEHTLLDLCAGTGDITFEYLPKTIKSCHAYLIDFSADMLECAKMKSSNLANKDHQLNYLEADVHQIPLKDSIADAATMAYGIRNVKNPRVSIGEVYRLLKPEAKFGILELTQPKNSVLRFGHRLYLKYFLPIIGKFLTSDRDAYQYLCNSINTFIAPREIEKMMKESGFINTKCIPLSAGIATLIIGQKK